LTAVFAHRGATASARENTLEAFAEARALGADGVELDVRRSRDGALVVHHDEWVEGAGLIAALDVATCPATCRCSPRSSRCAAHDGEHRAQERPGSRDRPERGDGGGGGALLAESGWWERVVVSSFRSASIDALRAVDDRPPIGWLLGLMADAPAALDEAMTAATTPCTLVTRSALSWSNAPMWRASPCGVDGQRPTRHRAPRRPRVDTIITDTPPSLAIVGRAPLG